jgi:hypothetical protein
MARTKEEIETDRIMAEVRSDKQEVFQILKRAGIELKQR